jgi:diguanylate cyclase (GGDEF)-like protein
MSKTMQQLRKVFHMLKHLSIRKKLIYSILLGSLVPFILGGIYIKTLTENWLYKNNIEQSHRLLLQTANHVDDTILKNMENLVEMMALDSRITQVSEDVTTYVDYDAQVEVNKNSKSESDIIAYFNTIKATQPYITLVSFGTETGGYVEVPEFKPSAPYDPRVRPWYMNALSTETATLSEPYITSVSHELVFAVAKNVTHETKKVGVVSLTVKLASLMEHINTLKNGETGFINILSSKDVFINSPKHPEWVLKSIDEVGEVAFHDIDNYHNRYYEAELDGIPRVFNVYISPYSGWKYISSIDKSEVLAQSRYLTALIFGIYIVTFFVILLLILFISNLITKPILEIAHVINKMATFHLDLIERKSIEIYTHQNDEIGEITRALSTMQTNFIELQSNITLMDKQIQNVNIDAPSAYQLVLSESSPFLNISNSVNELLRKVHSSILETREYSDEIMVQLEEIESQKDYISFLAEHDPLTNLPNRRKFYDTLHCVLARDGIGAVVLLDLDNFKGINDTLGHVFGDKVLQHISNTLQSLSTSNVFVSRFGGDEFLLLFEWENGYDETLEYVKTIQSHFDNSFIIDQNEIKIEFSVGVSLFPKDSTDINQLIMNADLALYSIKNSGKNNFAYFSTTMAEHLKFKLDIKDILREAIANDGFKMVYQPIVNIHTGEIVSFEALVRLKNNPLSPGVFIPLAEEEGMILSIGRITTQMVLSQMAAWRNQGLKPIPVSINYSAIQIHDYQYKQYLLDLMKLYEIPAHLIILELTENVFLENKDSTIAMMKELRSYGIQIAIDDFGTGYSSLSYLTYLPIDTIKLDRSLNLKFLELENINVMDSLIALAHSLNLKVIAEGIESYEHVRRLRVGKCDAIQGYYFSQPLEVEEVENRGHQPYSLK